MRKFPLKTWLLAGFCLLMPCVLHAAGLGQLQIKSSLGQPLLAEVDLLSVGKDEAGSLNVRLASPEAFRQANLEYSAALIGVRTTIERRPGGQPYVKIVSTRPMNEPFVDMLLELSWSQGKLLREYTVLVDPPNYAPPSTAVATAPLIVPPVVTAQSTSTPITPVAPVAPAEPAAPAPEAVPPVTAGAETPAPEETQTPPPAPEPQMAAPAPSAPAMRPAPAPRPAMAQEYTTKHGDTLFKVANTVKPDGITTEQMLVSLFRNNPDAFEGKNMNRLKAGRILRVPDEDQAQDLTPAQAVKEVHVQTANWNAYRARLAEAAGEAPAQEAGPAASGKITTVEQATPGKPEAKDVLKLSGGGKGTADDRVHALEEESASRQKALDEANARITQLQKNIDDMKHLLELKGQVPAAPATPAQPATPAVPDIHAVPAVTPPVTPAPAVPDAAKATTPPATPPAAATDAATPPAEPPKPPQPKKPKIVAPPPPPPGLLDTIMGNPVYLGGIALALVVLGGGGYFAMKKRGGGSGEPKPAKKDKKDKKDKKGKRGADDANSAPGVGVPSDLMSQTLAMPAALANDDVDAIDEADLYLNFGRDVQAEEVLKEALEKNPKNEKAELKLLQIYAGRKDATGFENIAKRLHEQTGGEGENWAKAAAMGYALDAANPLYAAGASASPAAAAGGASGVDLDFDLDLSGGAGGDSPTTTAVDLETGAGAALEKTMVFQPGELTQEVHDITNDSGLSRSTPVPDFTLNAPGATAAGLTPAPSLDVSMPDITLDAPDENATAVTDVALDTGGIGQGGNMIDFSLDAPGSGDATASGLEATDVTAAPALDPDFKLDLGGLGAAAPAAEPALPDLNLGDIKLDMDAPAAPAASTTGGQAKDERWFDVQTKFDLAKAYQEMGDKDGAREILQEVIKEGDGGQKAEAQKLLDTL